MKEISGPKLYLSDSCIGIGTVLCKEKYSEVFIQGVLDRLSRAGLKMDVEMLGWWGAGNTQARAELFAGSEHSLGQIHGRIGSDVGFNKRDNVKVAVVNACLSSTGDLLEHNSSGEFLFHSKEVIDSSSEISEKGGPDTFIWVENGVGGYPEILSSLDCVSDLLHKGVPSGFMFDVSHFLLGEYGGEFANPRQLSEGFGVVNSLVASRFCALGEVSLEGVPLGIHFEVGQTRDALPSLEGSYLKGFGEAVSCGGVARFVIENQQSGLGAVYTGSRDIDKLYGKVSETVDVLTRNNVVTV